MRTIFKVFIEFVMILLLFFFFFLLQDLISPARDRTLGPCIGRGSLNHWTASKVP